MVDDGRTDDGPWLYYKLTNEPKGSGKLTRKPERKLKQGNQKLKLKQENQKGNENKTIRKEMKTRKTAEKKLKQ